MIPEINSYYLNQFFIPNDTLNEAIFTLSHTMSLLYKCIIYNKPAPVSKYPKVQITSLLLFQDMAKSM